MPQPAELNAPRAESETTSEDWDLKPRMLTFDEWPSPKSEHELSPDLGMTQPPKDGLAVDTEGKCPRVEPEAAAGMAPPSQEEQPEQKEQLRLAATAGGTALTGMSTCM